MTEPETYRSSGLKRQKSDRDSLLCIAGVCLQEMCHRKVECSQEIMSWSFQTASSSVKIHRSKRYSLRFARSSRRSQDRSIYGSSVWRSAIPFKKPSINSATWQTPFSTRPVPTQQRHGQATYPLRDP